MKYGTTFSTLRISEMHLPLSEAFDELLDFGFDLIRIATYWNMYEKVRNSYEYADLENIVSECQKKKQKIMLTVGAKSPRWPEFHIPNWALENSHKGLPIRNPLRTSVENISNEISNCVEHTVSYFKKYDCIQAWQVENEPLDPSGPRNWTIPNRLLEREIEIVKSLDKRPVVINIWGNTLSERKLLSRIPKSADIIGIDLYYSVPARGNRYTSPKDSDSVINKQLQKLKKPIFITELQAEPWENQFQMGETPSMNPKILKDNIQRVSTHIQAEQIMFWGFEHWYQQRRLGNYDLWNTVKGIINT